MLSIWPSFMPWIRNFYKNISSCVLNNGLHTGPFIAQRRVRQGDPPSLYYFILVLEVLAISTRENKSSKGI